MSVVALYPWIKALHVAAALIFAAGVMAVAAFLWAAGKAGRDVAAMAATLRRWDRAVTTPAMLLVLVLGFFLARSGGWFGAPWLHVKLAVALLLAAAHGMQAARLRRLAGGAAVTHWRMSPWIVAGFAGVVMLAVLKPV